MTFTLLDLSKCEQHYIKKWQSTVNSRERETVQWWTKNCDCCTVGQDASSSCMNIHVLLITLLQLLSFSTLAAPLCLCSFMHM